MGKWELKRDSNNGGNSNQAKPKPGREFLQQTFAKPREAKLGDPLPLRAVTNSAAVSELVVSMNKALKGITQEAAKRAAADEFYTPMQVELQLRELSSTTKGTHKEISSAGGTNTIKLSVHVERKGTTLPLLPLIIETEDSVTRYSPERILTRSVSWQEFKWKQMKLRLLCSLDSKAANDPRSPVILNVGATWGKETHPFLNIECKDCPGIVEAVLSMKLRGVLPDSFGLMADPKSGEVAFQRKEIGKFITKDSAKPQKILIFPPPGSEKPRNLEELAKALNASVLF